MPWTMPEDVREQVRRLWIRGRILSARVTSEPLFPLSVRMVRPDARELSERFAEARAWIRALEEGSKNAVGAGYEIAYVEVNHRQLGTNRVPQTLVVPSEQDALALIGKQREAALFERLLQATRGTHPELVAWIRDNPLALLDHAEDWSALLGVASWFRVHPRAGVYARQIDMPGVHSKLIESRRKVIAELLDLVMPAEAVDRESAGAAGFERRYGLRSKSALIRFRLLGPRLRVGGLTDIATPAEQFAGLDLPVRHVFITENEINGLAFPDADESIVIFGLGYGLERLAAIPWLRDKAVHYWGDLDTHGFAILDKLRAILPAARSLLMDRETLLAHRALWGRESSRHDKPLARLTAEECAVYDDLRFDRLDDHVRLEQERIGFACVERAVAACASA
jgi:hypothetical protein